MKLANLVNLARNTQNSSPTVQERALIRILRASPTWRVLRLARQLGLPNWYLAAGCISQPVWNALAGFPLGHGIKDYDLVYYDPDTSYQAEDTWIKNGVELFNRFGFSNVEIRNQARVHLWYPKYPELFPPDMPPHSSVEAAIASYHSGAGAIGVRLSDTGAIVYAPFGLHDIFHMIVRPNKSILRQAAYERKVAGWLERWPSLTIIPWDQI